MVSPFAAMSRTLILSLQVLISARDSPSGFGKGAASVDMPQCKFPPMYRNSRELRVCEQSKGQWTNEWENFAHRGDTHYYWLTGEFQNNDAENEKNDHWALDNGYVANHPDHGGCNGIRLD